MRSISIPLAVDRKSGAETPGSSLLATYHLSCEGTWGLVVVEGMNGLGRVNTGTGVILPGKG